MGPVMLPESCLCHDVTQVPLHLPAPLPLSPTILPLGCVSNGFSRAGKREEEEEH